MSVKLKWNAENRDGFIREVARLGTFEVTITSGGAGTIGTNVYVGTFAGAVVAISSTVTECERAILGAVRREILRAGADLGKVI